MSEQKLLLIMLICYVLLIALLYFSPKRGAVRAISSVPKANGNAAWWQSLEMVDLAANLIHDLLAVILEGATRTSCTIQARPRSNDQVLVTSTL